ncbi:MAG: hydrogenase maturation nickel metallochaperone HypA, partial [Blautia sp.]|nr:hydrogenase maturation nickel metallochaperone HypA [Blautia sp.]
VVGEGRDIVVDYFESLFQFLARGTVAEGASIEIQTMPYQVRCNACGEVFHLIPIDQRTWTCPSCGAYKDYKLVSGMEFYISKIEASRHIEA